MLWENDFDSSMENRLEREVTDWECFVVYVRLKEKW